MNFKNVSKFYFFEMLIFCLLNPIYFVGLFFAHNFLKFEKNVYKNFSEKNNIHINKVRTVFDEWPTTGVSEEEKLENMLSNQASKLLRTNSMEDLKKYNELEEKLEDFYNRNY